MFPTLFRASMLAAALLTAAGATAQQAAMAACPFKPSELQAGLGVSFSEGRADRPLEAGGLKRLSCRYESKQYTLLVSTTLYLQNPADAKKYATALAGKMAPIPNDPDGAAYQEGQGDLTDPALHYAKNGFTVELRVLGIYYKDASSKKADLHATREKLAKLRRLS